MIERDSKDVTSSVFSSKLSFSSSTFFSLSSWSGRMGDFNFPKVGTGAPICFFVDFRDHSDLFDVGWLRDILRSSTS
jgi:hypothetical protein